MNDENKRERLYLSPPQMSGEGYELEFVHEAFDTNWIAPIGPHVSAFEKEVAGYVGASHAAAVTSGSAAIHLALIIIGVEPGDEVICSSFTFCASVNPVIYQKAKPTFIDSDEISWNMDPNLLDEELWRRAKIGKLPKAAIVVDLYGQSADFDPIRESCREYNVKVIEDAAEALGAEYKGKKCGTFGSVGIFSFNGNKIITTSGGGMLISEDEEFIRKARFLATQARDDFPHYQHTSIGYNYRMSNVLAGIGRGQMKVIDDRVSRRREIFDYYRMKLKNMPGIRFMPESDYSRCNRWLTCITVDPREFGGSREDIRIELEKHNIESRSLWKPMHLQPVFEGCEMCGGAVSEKLFETGLCLPSGGAMSHDDLDHVIHLIRSIYDKM